MFKGKLGQIDSILTQTSSVNGVNVYKVVVSAGNVEELKSMGDELRNKMKSGVGVLFSVLMKKSE